MGRSMITLAQITVLSAYLIIITKRFGVLESISHSTYQWLGNERYYFMLMCWALAGLNLAQGMEGWGVLTAGALGFTGITVNWMESKSPAFYIHSIGAFTAIISAFTGLIVLHGIWLPFFLFMIVSVAIYKLLNNRIWWIEVSAFILILIGYTLR